MSMPTPVAGATHDRTVPGDAKLPTHPNPRPVKRDSAPMTAPPMRAAFTMGRIRSRTDSPGPIHSQPM